MSQDKLQNKIDAWVVLLLLAENYEAYDKEDAESMELAQVLVKAELDKAEKQLLLSQAKAAIKKQHPIFAKANPKAVNNLAKNYVAQELGK